MSRCGTGRCTLSDALAPFDERADPDPSVNAVNGFISHFIHSALTLPHPRPAQLQWYILLSRYLAKSFKNDHVNEFRNLFTTTHRND